ncbi:MAG TPA: 3-keto-5-aminohexanoate cleavage protein [Ferrovibrio sp.]|uniref:3-keto-5-aminohexanoate cleavage protein n=1 Tax=Ferrovibrio sp. TaxID=1917215 RepID=UPI002B4B523D|nr:3-keto-5-aminohexanoate cleavage protein [Ferrovibrio sp.]HLT76852.1 3-keto-5-aminohexanoate cleavage protein [Ferrovibrio sp.]
MSAPAIIAVAPNGARKLKADHPAVPLSADELGRCAADCAAAGAAMIHLHVREPGSGRHSLDAGFYREAIRAVRREAGEDLIIQCTSEAAGIYNRHEQMAAMRALMPEACSLAVREILPDAGSEKEGAAFLAEFHKAGVMMQYILYSDEDVRRFLELKQRGIIPGDRQFVLFVLGRYTAGQRSEPTDLLPFLHVWPGDSAGAFAVCAFGAKEAACALTALSLHGHARIGFENNTLLSNGETAPDNAALVRQTASNAGLMGRSIATPKQAREMLAILR